MKFYGFKDIICTFIKQKRRKGIGVLSVAIMSAFLTGIIAYSTLKLNESTFSGFNNFMVFYNARQYAEAEATILKAVRYDDLTARSKAAIQNSNGYKSEIILSAENNYSDNVKQRIATVNIYHNNDERPYYSLNVLKISATSTNTVNAIPVGTIIPWASSTAPNEGGKWLLCNGGTFSSTTYPKLYSVLGKTTLPSLNGRFLEGTTSTPGSTKSAGLPNIAGTIKSTSGGNQFSDITSSTITYSGAIVPVYGSSYNMENRAANTLLMGFTFDASKSNAIYGNSTTVQPPSYLVRYYIKAS